MVQSKRSQIKIQMFSLKERKSSTAAMMSSSEPMMSDVAWVQISGRRLERRCCSSCRRVLIFTFQTAETEKQRKLNTSNFPQNHSELNWTSRAEKLDSFHLKTKTHQSSYMSILHFWWTSCVSHPQKHKLKPVLVCACDTPVKLILIVWM